MYRNGNTKATLKSASELQQRTREAPLVTMANDDKIRPD